MSPTYIGTPATSSEAPASFADAPINVIPTADGLIEEASALKLARYAQILGYHEAPFWGVNYDLSGRNCREIWLLSDRRELARYLAEAQEEIEQEIGYPLGVRWIEEDRRVYRCPEVARHGYLIEAGVKAMSLVGAGAIVDHTSDPAIIGPVATTATDANEIMITHPGTEIAIYPSMIEISAGSVTIEIPRSRMVVASVVDNDEGGLDYTDLSNFEATVDIYRVYNDPSTQGTLHKNHSCTLACSAQGCTNYTQDACIYITQDRIGAVQIYPARYSSGSWLLNSTSQCCAGYQWMTLRYKAGKPLTRQAEDAIIRLAHAKMPAMPCTCDPIRDAWERDRNVPDPISRERLNCPFGLNDGAWIAWRFARSMKLYRAGTAL